MRRLLPDDARPLTAARAGGQRPARPSPPPTLRLTRRGRLVLLALATTAVVLVILLVVALVRLIAGPAEPVGAAEPVATVDPSCVPTPDTSQNCWPAITEGNDDRMVRSPWVTGRILAGDVEVVLNHVAARYDATVEPVDPDSSWGWAYRSVRGEGDDGAEDADAAGGSELSNHASGTSIDLNATDHPLGVTDTFSDRQVEAIHAILAEVAPVVAWGGDFDGRADEMHFEIVGDPTAVAEVAARLRAAS